MLALGDYCFCFPVIGLFKKIEGAIQKGFSNIVDLDNILKTIIFIKRPITEKQKQ